MARDIKAIVASINQRAAERNARINGELDARGMAYRVRDCDGNEFCYGGMENGAPRYRGIGGSKHIFDMRGLEVVQAHA